MMRSFRLVLILVCGIVLPLACAADCMGPYPPSMVKAFNQSCSQDSKVMPFCVCLMDQIQKNIPLADFIEISNTQGGINNDPRFIKASKQCSGLLPASSPASPPAKNAVVTKLR